MIDIVRKKIIKFISQPLLTFRDSYDRGEEIFQHLFYNRTNDRNQLKASMELSKSMTIVGNPGEGKTCLMHFMFLQTKNENKFFPIILDYRNCAPRKKETLIIKFVEQFKPYFVEIGHELKQIAEKTNYDNYDLHHSVIMDCLRKISNQELEDKKKAVIFLDDLDYYENDYISLLKEYFLPFALNAKTVLILSGRKPLINSLSEDDELRHAFSLNPRRIFLVRVDLKTLFEARLSSLYPESAGKTYFTLFNAFKNPEQIGSLLRQEAMKYLKRELKNENVSTDVLHFLFGFNDIFWTHLGDVTGRNIRQIEETLPDMYEFHSKNAMNEINFSSDFASSYIISMVHEPNYLLDLISIKTTGASTKTKGNSLYQLVLEYLYAYNIIDSSFYAKMDGFGIKPDQADAVIKKLSLSPYALFDPEYVYTENETLRQYKINRKGKFYLDHIINNKFYYDTLTERYKKRNSDLPDGISSTTVTPSARSLIRE